MRIRALLLLISTFLALFSFSVQSESKTPVTLITNADVFDGVNEKLIKDTDVLIEGNLIRQIGRDMEVPADAIVIDAAGRTMIPGLIDTHWHMTMAEIPQTAILFGDMSEVAIRGALASEPTLLRGFTTVRNLGGNTFAIKKLIDEGTLVGPRIFPSGPVMSQTGGHYDYRLPFEVPAESTMNYWGRNGFMVIADGVPEVQKRAREIFRMGASQIKFAAGGGVASVYDPVDVRQYSLEEMKAIVDVAKSYNSYAAVHVFTDEAVEMALEAGVMSMDHGFLISEKVLKKMKAKGAWLSIQPLLNDEDAFDFSANPVAQKKWIEVTDATNTIYPLAKEVGVNIAFGTDLLMDKELAAKQGKFLAKLGNWFTGYEALKIATSENARLLALSGPRSPYQAGPLGVLKEGAYADLILVDGNPLENLDLVANPEDNFDLIMKDGEVFKNTLH
ncbi:amidohydrolase family protein [Seongchinamella sediminis]|uniref:Amidohydrolase family protein n=2 Tax=Seongchinamella sediminis TaxID=2283635 RepID=A0A3L7DXU6_9GAMM|nr:amidohydrolase family protein [Seongchinamella sediminis]